MATQKEIMIPELKLEHFSITVRNMKNSTMLQNKFSEKAAESIKKGQTGQGMQKAKAMDINEEFLNSQYKTPDGKLGVEAKAVKATMVNAASIVNLKMTDMRKAFQIIGDVIPFKKHSKPILREDYLTNPTTRGKNLRIRAEIKDWELEVTIAHNPNYVSASQLANLLSNAGFHCGFYDNRPFSKSSSGNHGMFEVVANGRK